ncbi:MAG: hypothetical protein KatS3mg021_0568 [Fimbriimonadales bacterium]|nr:MAG: hypothetical protein KatS3mg021_0568 [Fimbriimonadales bacterium]
MKAQKVRKGFGLRGVRAVLGSRVGRGLAVGLTLLLLHLDVAPAVASASVNPRKEAKVASESLATRLMLWAMRVWTLQVQLVDKPPLAPAPGLPPVWGVSASVYGGVVNLGNGNLCLQIPLVGWANGVSFSLVFNSQANPSQPSPIAPKWTHNWHVFLQVSSDGKQATLQEGDGSRWVFRDTDLDGVFTPPTGVFDRLVRQNDGRYVLERKGSEERWEFAVSGSVRLLERVVDRYGRAIALGYANGRLETVTDRYNRSLTLVYQGSRLWKVVDFTGRAWELQYDGNGRLWKVVFPAVEDENGQARTYQIVLGYNARGECD